MYPRSEEAGMRVAQEVKSASEGIYLAFIRELLPSAMPETQALVYLPLRVLSGQSMAEYFKVFLRDRSPTPQPHGRDGDA